METKPDFEKLFELIVMAKGETRSMRKFTAAAGVSQSLPYRIKHGEVCPDVDTLMSFVSDKADPQNGVTLEDLVRAAGLEEKKSPKRKVICLN